MTTLKQLRLDAGLSQREAGVALSTSQWLVWAWEAGKVYPSGRSMVKLAALYGVGLGEILDALPAP